MISPSIFSVGTITISDYILINFFQFIRTEFIERNFVYLLLFRFIRIVDDEFQYENRYTGITNTKYINYF